MTRLELHDAEAERRRAEEAAVRAAEKRVTEKLASTRGAAA